MSIRTIALCLLLLLVPTKSRGAGPYDPEVEYFTLTTPHFYIMYPDGYGHIALRSAEIAEGARGRLVERYGWEPSGRVSIVINDQTDYANGSATIIPLKVITVFVTAPDKVSGLEDYDDWLTTVIVHEMTHIWHLDMVYGLPWIGRLFLGKYVSMNNYTATWATEGIAVYEETISSGAGRGRSKFVDMVVRTASLEQRFPPIDQAYRGYPNYPYSNIAYFFGGRFQLWIAERYGEEKLLEYHRAYAANPIAYITYIPAMAVFDQSIESLWDEFAQEMIAESERALAQISTTTVTEPQRLTFYGGSSLGPRVTPDGKHVVFSTSSSVDGPRVRRMKIDGSEQEVLVEDTLSQAISFTPDGKAFYCQQTEINQRFYQHNSILRYEIATGGASRIKLKDPKKGDFLAPSGSLRARDPDISPDGKQIVFVQTPYASNRLVLAELDADGITIDPEVIVKAEPDVQLSTPRFSPDGKRIAVSRFKGGRRDIVLFDRTGELLLELTRDRAQDTDPTFSFDGRWLVFVSDRTGIYNLYAWDLQQRQLRQLTNLVTGAFQPTVSPDGKTLVYRGYSVDGFDIFRLPFEPDKGTIVELVRMPPEEIDMMERAWPPILAGVPDIPPPAPFKDTPMPKELPNGWTIGSYSALDTILPFNDNWNLFPAIGANEREFFGSLTHLGIDARGTQSYSLSLTYGSYTKFVGGSAVYNYDALEPTFSFLGLAEAVTYSTPLAESTPEIGCPFGGPGQRSDGRIICNSTPDGLYNEQRLGGQFSISLPFRQRHAISISYRFEDRRAWDEVSPITPPAALPPSGKFARVRMGYAYSNTRAFPYSISRERGPVYSLALSAFSKGLGSDYEQFLAETVGSYYLNVPWFDNHVIASRVALGVGGGPDLGETFRLGGNGRVSALTTMTENFHTLRGLKTATLTGQGVLSGTLEYRAPIFRVDRGLGTLPFIIRVFHLAVFADFGRVFDEIEIDTITDGFIDAFAVGVGAELRADVLLAYSLPLTLNVGYAYAVVEPTLREDAGMENGDLYFTVGSQF